MWLMPKCYKQSQSSSGDTPCGGNVEYLHRSTLSRRRRWNGKSSALGNSWATLFLGDINTVARVSSLRMTALHNLYCTLNTRIIIIFKWTWARYRDCSMRGRAMHTELWFESHKEKTSWKTCNTNMGLREIGNIDWSRLPGFCEHSNDLWGSIKCWEPLLVAQ
jgi:hypothetical protein